MPPSSGKRDESSATTSPCGTKKNRAARIHSPIALGPDLAAVASHRSPSTATRLNNTRSRSPSARSNEPAPAEASLARCSGAPGELTALLLRRDGQVADVHVEVVIHAQPNDAVRRAELVRRQRGHLRAVHQEAQRIGLRRV